MNGIVLSFLSGQALCTTVAVVGGKSLAAQISEKFVRSAESCLHMYLHFYGQTCDSNIYLSFLQVALSGGVLFIIFGIQSFLSSVEP